LNFTARRAAGQDGLGAETVGAAATLRGVDGVAGRVGDQRLMWTPAGVLLTVFGLALLAAWRGEAGRRARAAGAPVAGPSGGQASRALQFTWGHDPNRNRE